MSEATESELTKAVVLYEGEGDESEWKMYAWGGDKMARDYLTGNESFLTHRCANKENVAEVYIFPDTHKACWRCQAPLPDGLRALWIMHNGEI